MLLLLLVLVLVLVRVIMLGTVGRPHLAYEVALLHGRLYRWPRAGAGRKGRRCSVSGGKDWLLL